MDFKHHIETAWKLTLDHIVPLILITLVFVGVSAVTLGILAPVATAGYFHSLLQLARNGREPKVQDLFSHMHLFLPLLGFSIVAIVAIMVGFMMLFLPGLLLILALAFCCIYMLPLMADKNMALVDAIKESYAMARRGDIIDHVVVVIIFMGITMIGGSAIIGMLFTQPLAMLFLVSAYEEKSNLASPPAPPQP